MIPEDVKRNHVVLDDMIKYYDTNETEVKLRRILKKYGEMYGKYLNKCIKLS